MIFLYFGKPRRFWRELKANLRFILLISLVQIFGQYALFYSGLNLLSSTSRMIGGLMLSIVSVPFEGTHLGPFPQKYWIALAWLSFLSAAAITIWNLLLTRPGVKVSMLNIWKFLIPVSGATLSWLIMPNEKPDLVSILGMAVIAIALIALNFANRRLQKSLLG